MQRDTRGAQTGTGWRASCGSGGRLTPQPPNSAKWKVTFPTNLFLHPHLPDDGIPCLKLVGRLEGEPCGPENRTLIPSLAWMEERRATCVDWSTSPWHEHQVLLKQAALFTEPIMGSLLGEEPPALCRLRAKQWSPHARLGCSYAHQSTESPHGSVSMNYR